MHDRAPDLSWAVDRPLRTAAVIYESEHGKTRAVAEAFADGLRSEGLSVDVLSVDRAQQRPVDGYDLLVLGSPSVHLASSPGMHRFLETLKRMPQLKDHYGYAFDTRVRHHSGGAGRQIEASLLKAGLRIPGPRAHALVEPPGAAAVPSEPPSDGPEFRLEPGTLDRFRSLGSLLVRSIRGEVEGRL